MLSSSLRVFIVYTDDTVNKDNNTKSHHLFIVFLFQFFFVDKYFASSIFFK